jgi:hypothetical protein
MLEALCSRPTPTAQPSDDMYAIDRLNSFDPDRLASAPQDLAEFDRMHAAQPGFDGSVVVSLDERRRVALNLWEDSAASRAGLSVLGPHVARLLVPLMSEPSQLIGAGEVINFNLPS